MKGDLIDDWEKRYKGKKGKYVWNLEGFDQVKPMNTDYLLGLFEPDHMKYEYERTKNETLAKPLKEREPSLKEMVKKAIEILKKNKNGFALVVEAGRIDHAHHESMAAFAILETLALNDAVEEADRITEDDETLIIVTADHSHTFSLGGYATMENPVFGVNDDREWPVDDGKNYTNVGYANGPGYKHPSNRNGNYSAARKDPVNEEVTKMTYAQDSLVPLYHETHGGEDVGIYAKGPMAHLFHSTHEQHYIAHVAMRSLCVGIYKNDCRSTATIFKINHIIKFIPYLLAIFKFFI